MTTFEIQRGTERFYGSSEKFAVSKLEDKELIFKLKKIALGLAINLEVAAKQPGYMDALKQFVLNRDIRAGINYFTLCGKSLDENQILTLIGE